MRCVRARLNFRGALAPHRFAQFAKGAWQNVKLYSRASRGVCVQADRSRFSMPLRFRGHRMGYGRAPSPTAFGRQSARVRHPQPPTQRQTQKPINFTVNCRSGIIHSRGASRRQNMNREGYRGKCAPPAGDWDSRNETARRPTTNSVKPPETD